MSDHDIESHIKVYWNVFFALIAFTILTVAVSYIPFDEYNLPFTPMFWALLVGLSIALFKGYLVAGFFMHLNDERKSIYYLLGLSVIFLFVLLFIPMAWRGSAESHNGDYQPYITKDEYVTYKEPEHHDTHHEEGH